jgi:hypothetical protein
VLLWGFLPCKAVYDNIIYRCKYVTDFMNVGIKLLNIEMKETNNGHTRDYIGHIRLLFHKVSYPSYDAPLFLL